MATKKTIAVMGATGAQGGGLVRAILNDASGEFGVRAITRNPDSDKARALQEQGAEVVKADLDDPESIREAFDGAYGAYCVTFYWAHLSPEKELGHIRTMARAARDAGLEHVVWSTLEDTRKWVPLDDDRMPTLMENYKVPHFDAKGEGDRFFEEADVPVTYYYASWYFENMIYFGNGPQPQDDGTLAITFPMGDKKIAGIASADIGKCAYGIFKGGEEFIGRRIGVAGDHFTCDELAAQLSAALGMDVRYNEVSPEVYRGFGFPGADDLGNMFQFYRDFEEDCLSMRDPGVSRRLNPELQDLPTWLERNSQRIPIEEETSS